MCASLVNFRPVGGSLLAEGEITEDSVNSANILKLCVYRSGRLDKITEEDFEVLKNQLDIRSVIDLRTFEDEYKRADGEKVLDKQDISVQRVDEVAMERQGATDILWKEEVPELVNSEELVKHFMIGVTGSVFMSRLRTGKYVTFCQKIWFCFLLFLDGIFGTRCSSRYMQRVFAMKGLLNMYKMIIDYSGIAIRSVLQLMCQPENLPCIITCHAGKDRTGIISALVLAVCGYDHYTIGDDYIATEIAMPNDHPEVAHLQKELRPAPREVIIGLLEYVYDTYGSVSYYLESIGFSLDDQDILRDLVTT